MSASERAKSSIVLRKVVAHQRMVSTALDTFVDVVGSVFFHSASTCRMSSLPN
ncbi:hypothetical protein [Lentzea kristufekii]|uniref:hypothetical protein n=1 Tax=Lentzea kristufekii TaxID=3095430 RepID=UPI003873C8A3